MERVVCELDHSYELATELESVTELLRFWSVVFPYTVMTGRAGPGLTVTIWSAEVLKQYGPLYTLTEYVPAVSTMMERVVSPFDQRYPAAGELVSTMEFPWQMSGELLEVITGTEGIGLTFTFKSLLVPGHEFELTVTVYTPACCTVMDRVVAPVDQA
jgi:hypothetical protein